MKKALISAAICAVALSACSDSKPSRNAVMKSLVNNVIVPAYERSAKSSADLETAVGRACTNPAAVSDANDALLTARINWKHTEAVFLGPVMDKRTDAYVDYKVDTADVLRLATSATPVTLDEETVGKRVAADQRGYGALEYLLASERMAEPRFCEYAKSIVAVAADQQQAALDAWTKPQGDEPPYSEAVLKDPTMSLDDLVNDNINLLRVMSDTELRAAVGRNGAAGDPTAIKEGAMLDGTEMIRARVEGIQAALIGGGTDTGITPLLTPETTDKLRKSLNDALLSMQPIQGSLRIASQSEKQKVTDVAEHLDAVRRILSTEVVSQLGIAVGFSDSDGDSAA